MRLRHGGLRRRAWRKVVVVLFLIVCGSAAGAWAGNHRTQQQQAQAAILVTPLLGNPFSPEVGGDNLVNLTTEAELVTSDPVAQLVSEKMPGHPAVDDLLSGVSVKVPPNTQILQITVRQPSGAEALDRAQAFATTFLAYRTARMESTVFDRSARVKQLVTERTNTLKGVEQSLAKLARDPVKGPALRQQAVDLTSQISELRTQLASLEAASTDPGQVVTRAGLRSSLLANAAVLIAAGALAGLLLGVALVAVRGRVRDRVLVPEDLSGLDVPVFGPVVEDIEGYRRLRAALLGAFPHRPMVALVGTTTPGQAGSRVTEGLAASLGSAGLEVIVVDAIGELSGPGTGPGLSDVIMEPGSLDDALRTISPHVAGLAPGRAPRVLDDLVDSPEMDVLLQELRKRADIVLVVGGSLGYSRAASLARLADAVLIEVVEGDCGIADVHATVSRLDHRAAVAAVFLPAARRKRATAVVPDVPSPS